MKTAKQIIQSIIDQGILGFLDFGELNNIWNRKRGKILLEYM